MATESSSARTTCQKTMAERLRAACATRLLPLLLMLPAAVQAQSYTNNYGIWGYETFNGAILILGYTGPGGAVTIPSEINGLPVTMIEEQAFFRCFSLTSVSIPNSVTTIWDYAFDECINLTSVIFEGNAPILGGPNVFYFDNNPTIYYVDGTTGWGPTFGGLSTCLFDPLSQAGYTTNNGTITITRYMGSGGLVIIPDTINGLPVTSIGDYAFFECYGLTSITIPDSVTSIGDSAFYEISSLTNVTISGSVISIGPWAFYNCSGLTSITIPNSVTSIGTNAFCGCVSLANLTIGNGVTNIGSDAFWSCTSLTNVIIPDSVTSIGEEAFEYCSSLTSVALGNGVTSIGEYAFYGCSSLNGAYFQGNAPSPDNDLSVFGGDSKASVYYLPGTTGWGSTFDGVPTALWNVESLGALQVSISPPTVISAGAQWQVDGGAWQSSSSTLSGLTVGSHTVAFSTVAGWTTPVSQKVTVSANQTATATGTYVVVVTPAAGFIYTTNNGTITITEYTGPGGAVTIPDAINGLPVTGIQAWAFYDCTSLANVTIPDSVTAIGEAAFQTCTSLTNVTIGNGLTMIGSGAFQGCTRLTSVSFRGNAPNYALDAFAGDNYVTVYHLPGTTGWNFNFSNYPTELWLPQVQASDANFGVRTNQFGFTVNWASGMTVAVDACTNLANPTWIPLATNTLTGSSLYFSDPYWTSYPRRFYRLRMP